MSTIVQRGDAGFLLVPPQPVAIVMAASDMSVTAIAGRSTTALAT
jgi:hypothetical protein